MHKVYVTRQIPEPGLELLRKNYEVEVNPEDRVLTREELLEKVRGRDAILCLLTDKIDAQVMDAAKGARIFANYAVGYDNIDVPEATKRDILITNTPGVLTETTADLAWVLLMAAARRVVEADRFTRAGKFKGWGPMLLLGTDVWGKTLGLVGAGRIGSALARRSVGFKMSLLYHDPYPNRELEEELGAKRVDLDTLLKESDFISIHVPLTQETHHLIGEKEFGLMKPSAHLVNTSRGPVVDEEALVRALRDRRIAGAGLDVYEHEPELTPGLAELDNVVLVPHIASASTETRTKMATMAAQSIVDFFEGRRPTHCVNPEVLK
ncbi:2-hydroxyacid dehydrogenase [Candidatus Hakubella thermalkaliphila]|uniref:Glyoxylate reductase n=1 Tax=Candidatus Hakubella thermalkaliphila TaxID=2754717 RepID=A0A6V8PAU2_9ACTN|nr:D-glycerate dehydrogenase [Candidatus Hakubella thermalkaliphila]GFP29463.1 glyoxylate reductase [Candidatus Hakubella thermalkaliphila]GFP41124.1 glyoxylate reductase [Candidatus Hakubella thermalkaliphila]